MIAELVSILTLRADKIVPISLELIAIACLVAELVSALTLRAENMVSIGLPLIA